jgi:hypothetical protein
MTDVFGILILGGIKTSKFQRQAEKPTLRACAKATYVQASCGDEPSPLLYVPLESGALLLPAHDAVPRLFSKIHMWRLLKEFLLFARQEKKWWLIPLVVLLLVLGAILIFASSSGIAWALYPFF